MFELEFFDDSLRVFSQKISLRKLNECALLFDCAPRKRAQVEKYTVFASSIIWICSDAAYKLRSSLKRSSSVECETGLTARIFFH